MILHASPISVLDHQFGKAETVFCQNTGNNGGRPHHFSQATTLSPWANTHWKSWDNLNPTEQFLRNSTKTQQIIQHVKIRFPSLWVFTNSWYPKMDGLEWKNISQKIDGLEWKKYEKIILKWMIWGTPVLRNLPSWCSFLSDRPICSVLGASAWSGSSGRQEMSQQTLELIFLYIKSNYM